MQFYADGWKKCAVPILRCAAFAAVLSLPISAPLLSARAQDNASTNSALGEKAKKVDGTLIYLPETVETSRLSRVKNQLIEVRGIISTYQDIKRRYNFTTDDGAKVLVIGEFPSQGGVSYWLRANVVEDGGKIALSEVQKWRAVPNAVAPPLPGSTQSGKSENLLDGPNAPLVLGGGVLILAALGTLGAMTMRNKSAEQRRLLEQQLEEERRRSTEAAKGNKGGGRGDASGGPGGTVVAGASGSTASSGGRSNARTVASRGTVKVETGPNAPGTFPLIDGETRIGRKTDDHCTVVLDKDAAISSYHSSIIVTRDGRLVYEDKSSNGSVVDGQFVQRAQRDIQSGSQIKIGATTLVVELFAPPATNAISSTRSSDNAVVDGTFAANGSDARRAPTVNIQMPSTAELRQAAAATTVGYGAELEVTAGPEAGQRFPITKATTTLGREDRDILLNDASVSRSHATITVREGKFLLSDDGSAHGTRVNGEPLTDEREIRNGDQILLGSKTTVSFHSVA